MKKLVCAGGFMLCLVFVNLTGKAQDFVYSQYQYTPIHIDPALISTYEDIQLTAHYYQNRLWKQFDVNNYQLSILYPMSLLKDKKKPQAAGLSLIRDNTGKQGLVSCTGGSLAFAQGVAVSNSSTLSAGFQMSGYFIGHNNPGNYTTGSQWVDGSGFDPSLGINEQINFETAKIFSIGTGFNWHLTDKNRPKADVGVSVFHINQPRYTFLNSNNNMKTRFVVHGNYNIYYQNGIVVSPRILYVRQYGNMFSMGTWIGYKLTSDNPFLLIRDCNIQAGIDYRYDHSGIISLNLDQPNYTVGVSYAMGMNRERTYSNYRANFEICLVVRFNNKKDQRGEYYIGDTRLIFDRGISKNTPEKYSQSDNFTSDSIMISGKKYKVQLRQDFKFKFNDATLTDEAHQYLDELANMLQQNPSLQVEVIGHTDDVGSDEANKIVSERRSKGVIDYLISKGVKSTRLKLTAKSKTEPLFPNDTEEHRSKNRRVEFIIYNE